MELDQEIIEEFVKENTGILNELKSILKEIEQDLTKSNLFEKFGQIVDRMMGAAKSLEFNKMGEVSDFCKTIGYKSSQSDDQNLKQISLSILLDAIETLSTMNDNLMTSQSDEIDPDQYKIILGRLEFLSDQLKHIQRASVAIDDDIESLLDDFNSSN